MLLRRGQPRANGADRAAGHQRDLGVAQLIAESEGQHLPMDGSESVDERVDDGSIDLSALGGFPVSNDPDSGLHLTPGIPADRAVCQRITDMVSDSRRVVVGLISVRSVVSSPLRPVTGRRQEAQTPRRLGSWL